MRPLLAALLLAAAVPASAATAVAVSVEELARTSAAVVRGRVTEGQAELGASGRIFTTWQVRTEAVLRGDAPAVAQVRVEGGVVGRLGQRVDGAASLRKGEEVVLFLERAGPDAFRVTGLAQGKFSVAGTMARPDLSKLVFIRTSVRPGERRAGPMPLAELARRVRTDR